MTLSHALSFSLSACTHKYTCNYYYFILKKLTQNTDTLTHTSFGAITKATTARSSHPFVYNNIYYI